MHFYRYSQEYDGECQQNKKINGSRKMAAALNAAASDIGKIGEWGDIGNRLSINGQLIKRYENTADENYREFHHCSNHVDCSWHISRWNREDIAQ